MKIKNLIGGGQVFFCPGCGHTHTVNTQLGPRWSYNNDPVKPTFSPSIKVLVQWSEHDPNDKDDICHSFVRDGKIQFLTDCTHEMVGKIVDIPDWPYAPGTYGGIVESTTGVAT